MKSHSLGSFVHYIVTNGMDIFDRHKWLDEFAMISFLLNSGHDPHQRDWSGRGILSYVNNAHCLQMLLDAGVDVHMRDDRGSTALHHAIEPDCIRMLVAYGADVNTSTRDMETPLHEHCSIERAQALIALGADVRARDVLDKTPLHNNMYSAEQALCYVSAGADPNALDNIGRSALFYLSLANAADFPYLMDAAFDLNVFDFEGCGFLNIAYFNGSEDLSIVNFAIKNGYDVTAISQSKETLLHCLAQQYCLSYDLVRRLVTMGVGVNACNDLGHTALHIVAAHRHPKRLYWLLQNKADPTIRDHAGQTPLDYAATDYARNILEKEMCRRSRRVITNAISPGNAGVQSVSSKRRM